MSLPEFRQKLQEAYATEGVPAPLAQSLARKAVETLELVLGGRLVYLRKTFTFRMKLAKRNQLIIARYQVLRCYRRVAEEFGMTPRQIRHIVDGRKSQKSKKRTKK